MGSRETAVLAATWLGAISAAFAAASWAIGMEMPARTRNGIYLIFLLGWFWLLVMVTRQLRDRTPPLLTATPLMRRIAAALFVSAMLLTGNTWEGARNLRRSAPEYRQALRARWQALGLPPPGANGTWSSSRWRRGPARTSRISKCGRTRNTGRTGASHTTSACARWSCEARPILTRSVVGPDGRKVARRPAVYNRRCLV